MLQTCIILTNVSMICDSPVIEADESKLDADKPMHLEYGFRMDNVSGVQNLTAQHGYNSFLLYPNPIYEPFSEEVKYYKSDYLTINVSRYSVAVICTVHRFGGYDVTIFYCRVSI